MGTRPIRELHARIEQLKASPIVRKRRLELPLEELHRAECYLRPNKAARILKPFGDAQPLLGKMLRLPDLE